MFFKIGDLIFFVFFEVLYNWTYSDEIFSVLCPSENPSNDQFYLLVRDNVNMFDSRTPSFPQAVNDAGVDKNYLYAMISL